MSFHLPFLFAKLIVPYPMELSKLKETQKMWALRKPILDAHIFALQENIKTLEQEIDAILMEKIRKK